MSPPVLPQAEQFRKPRVLFIGEAVTLAHIARPFALARSLNADEYDVFFACDPRYNKLLGELPFPWRPLHTIPSEHFLEALARGGPLYDAATLRGYVKEDLALLGELKPDVVVGDFRLSLAVSAPLTKTYHMAITNAYWSPYARQRFPLPELPLVRAVGLTAARVLFRLARPLAFALHTRPLNRIRRENDLPSLGLNLCRLYTHADYTLYADVPELVPIHGSPENHVYLGPIPWSPALDPPDWWEKVPTDRPIVYVTMGSSGESRLLHVVLEALADLPVYVMATTAGRINTDKVPANAHIAAYLPGEAAASRASLVICNGGSPTTQQALVAGRPVLGIPSNMDQYLNMKALKVRGAGEVIRSGKADVRTIRTVIVRMLEEPGFRQAARACSKIFGKYNAASRFSSLIAKVLLAPSRLSVNNNVTRGERPA
jgi:UDP:flavonoid glycosyltransferase YjiC (YdhE family)